MEGSWRQEHLYTLKDSYEFYEIYMNRIGEVDKETEKQLQEYEAKCNEGVIEIKKDDTDKSDAGKTHMGKKREKKGEESSAF